MLEKRYLPLFHDLENRCCLVVGGGEVAQRKVEQLLLAGAQVRIVAPQITATIREWAAEEACCWERRSYSAGDLQGCCLVIAATDDPAVNRQVYQDCAAQGVPVNVVDQPQLCTVIFPAVARRGPITLAISSAGQAPFLSKALRRQFENLLSGVAALDKPEILSQFRRFVQAQTRDLELQRRLYDRLLACTPEQWSHWSNHPPPEALWQQWLKEEIERQQ